MLWMQDGSCVLSCVSRLLSSSASSFRLEVSIFILCGTSESARMGGPDGHKGKEVNYQKSYFDVLGLCCSAEAVLIEKILKPLEGVQKISVVVPSKTVIVVHDNLLISQLQIVKALNEAGLEATVRAYGAHKIVKKWPSPYILACGFLLVISLFKKFFHPLKWLAIAAAVVGLPPVVLRSIAAIRRYTLDINILMLIAVGGAIALKDYTEAGSIVFLFTIAEWLESMAGHKAAAGMSLLMSSAPQKAILAETNQVVDVQDVKINTVIAVKAGEVVPIDGIVLEGHGEVDESSLTGESFPVSKQPESVVWAGTLNIDGYLSVRTTALANDSAVAKMARLVEEAQNSRSKTQRLIDSCTKFFTPAVVVIAAIVAVVPLAMRVRHPKRLFQMALVILVSACPCALVLSTPVATFCGLLKAARTGLLIKGGDVLEALASVKVVAFDKTGTITKGEFSVIHFQSTSDKVTVHTLLQWASSIESKSSHPMASSLVAYAKSNGIEPKPEDVKEFLVYPGEGISGEINGKTIYIGNKRIATRASCKTVPNVDIEGGITYGYMFSDMEPIGVFALSDSCRIGASQALKELKSLGIKVVMLTGDSTESAKHAQNQLGQVIDIHAELLPEDKVRLVGELKSKEGSTAMVGDGINDAPALAIANVGISMGLSGSAIAMETSHITLMSNDIRRIPKAVMLARRTYRKIISNMFFSVITKVAVLALAIAGHPLVWAAVLADVGTCLLVILNSMMLLQTKSTQGKKNCCSSGKEHNCCGSSSKEKKCCSRASEKCCSSSHKAHLERPKNVDHCASSTCHSPGPCRKSNNLLDNHNLHDHNKLHECEIQDRSCNQDLELELPNHHHCCQDKIKYASNEAKEHVISNADEVEHHCHHVHTEKSVELGSCKLNTGADCYKNNVTCQSLSICKDTGKKIDKGCCISNRIETHCSSSSQIVAERRLIGGCCRHHMHGYGRTSGCHEVGVIQLPEIVIE